MSQTEKKKKKKVVIIIGFIGIIIMAYVAISYQVEHNHRTSQRVAQAPKRQVIESVTSQNNTSQNNASQSAKPQDSIPSLASGAQIPSNIPPAMLKAMKERGMSVEQLRGSGQAAPTSMAGGQAAPTGMGDGQFPDAMQKALAERNIATQGTPSGMRIEATSTNTLPTFILGGIKHIENHRNQEQIDAIHKYIQILSTNPNDVQNLIDAANLFLKHNEVQSAKYLLQRATVAAPSNAQAAFLYGATLTKNFESEEAAKQWERSLSIQENAHVRFELARLYRYQLNQADLAKKYLEQALTSPGLNSALRGEIQRELDR